MDSSTIVTLIPLRDRTLAYLKRGRNMIYLRNRLALGNPCQGAYIQAIRDAGTDCPEGLELDLADMVRDALRAMAPRRIRRARRVV